jgi:hypothetical protein
MGTLLLHTIYQFSVNSSISNVALADLNGDTMPDIVVANFVHNNVGVFLNTGTGTFANEVTYPAGIEPLFLALADINDDHRIDTVVANQISDTISLLMNASSGTFLPKIDLILASASAPSAVVLHGLNNDTQLDIIVVNPNTGVFCVFLNNGDGRFLSPTNYVTGDGSYPISLAVNDMNADKIPDILVSYDALNTIGVYLNTGNGTFLLQATHPTGSLPYWILAEDVNNDQSPDIVVDVNDSSNHIIVFLIAC